MVKDSECPEDFRVWLMKQKLINSGSFGRAAPTEQKLMTEVTAVVASDGVKFGTIGEKTCVAKHRVACRDALNSGSSAGLARVVSDPAQDSARGLKILSRSCG